mmetsp:Transcript_48748/g.122089  ORF Transcript_48748/g.122089 Transcript_48748/m.122089 type:complete len:112 (-) Transcript_48748:837-1172(-)
MRRGVQQLLSPVEVFAMNQGKVTGEGSHSSGVRLLVACLVCRPLPQMVDKVSRHVAAQSARLGQLPQQEWLPQRFVLTAAKVRHVLGPIAARPRHMMPIFVCLVTMVAGTV